MAGRDADIIIHGGGIAGLWTLARLKNLGYDALLVEPNAIGGVQTIASQGIIHSGLKYALSGKINALAREISAMPDVWREALNGNGPVDLSKAKRAAETQYMMIPKGVMGSI
ncbi:MAG: FAD-dependent oxidoreductase [Micavibrio sp.]|nr:FAD-dependent oxidoreductase [Micavibrio sp.]